MCGIVGFIGAKPEKTLLQRLKQLEYRGYDSAGIAVKSNTELKLFKAKGEIVNLENTVVPLENSLLAIGHTRWATHGKPDEINAHPHVSSDGEWVVVHNGIIENYDKLKTLLEKRGYKFYSETDTEVIAKLLEYFSLSYNRLDAIKQTCFALEGSFALAIINAKENRIYFAKNKSPLYLAVTTNGLMLASDIICFKQFAEEYTVIEDNIFGYAENGIVEYHNKFGKVFPEKVKLDLQEYDLLNSYEHFMLKEIFETKLTIKNILEFYTRENALKKVKKIDFNKINKIKLIGCGTAYHAALHGAKIFESKLGVECSAHVASEFRYSEPIIDKNTLVVLISQSGETADTLGALELCKGKGAITFAVVNVEHSTLAKQCDVFFPIKAGVEIAVASTKAFSAQICTLYIIAEIISEKLRKSLFNMAGIETLYGTLNYEDLNAYRAIADDLRYKDKLFMIGRGTDYITALEASLKIKETSYINTDTYFAGELKHGFLALIEDDNFVIVFLTEKNTLKKTISNAEEARARGAKIIYFTCFELEEEVEKKAYSVIKVEWIDNILQSVINIVPWQLIAYYVSIGKGLNPDKPRNLAKSVTVE